MGIDFSPWEALAKNTVGKVVDKVIGYLPLNDQEKADLILKTREMDLEEEKQEMQENLQQLAINVEEAKSEHWFVSGGRPAFLWIGAAAFAYKFVIQPFLVFIVLCFNSEWVGFSKLPDLDWTTMATVVVPLLGISYHRSQEKQAIIAAKQ